MNRMAEPNPSMHVHNFRTAAGVILILAGAVLFLDRYLQTGWLSLLILPAVGLYLYQWGARMHHTGLIVWGALLGALGAGILAAFTPFGRFPPVVDQIGRISLCLGLGWLLVLFTTAQRTRTAWWAGIPAGILIGLGACLLYTALRWGDFVLYLSLGVAIPMLIWGLGTRLLGLAIPGSLLIGIGPGIYLAWQASEGENSLVRTGIMLVWFALGWALITLAGRIILEKYLWWPLIPGGIIVMVGLGLYIGGDPDNALGFIGNTGSIMLIIFGLYLLLMRKGIHHDD